jgi:hypothetical protein
MSDQPVARPLPTQGNTTQKDADKHPCLERDSNPRSQQPTGQDKIDARIPLICSSLCDQLSQLVCV